jgi:hypothetical protein
LAEIRGTRAVTSQIERLDKKYGEMEDAKKALVKQLLPALELDEDGKEEEKRKAIKKFFDSYQQFNNLLSAWVSSLIITRPSLPENNFISDNNFPKNSEEKHGFLESLIDAKPEWPISIICIVSIIAFVVLTAIHVVPWSVPIIVVGVSFCYFFSPQLAKLALSFRREDEAELLDQTNPTAWISEAVLKMRKDFDSSRYLIKLQEVPANDLPIEYKNMDPALWSRLIQEAETLPSTLISTIDQIDIYAKSCYNELKTQMIFALKPQAQPQFAPPQSNAVE